MPVVGLAEVLIQPSFKGTQSKIQKEVGPAARKAGRSAGKTMGESMADGFSAETAGLEAEAERLGKVVSKAQSAVAASKQKMVAASAAEEKALGDLRVAELQLSEARANANAKASQIAAAETRLTTARNRATQATSARKTAEGALTRSTTALGGAQRDASRASADLDAQMRRVAASADETGRSVSRLGARMRSAFSSSPLAGMADRIRNNSSRINTDLVAMARNMSVSGDTGGRGLVRGLAIAMGGLAALPPAAGAAGAALLAASGNVLTLGASLGQLAGLAALVPAGLMSIAAGAGVLAAAFHGVGDALKAITEAESADVGMNPRLQAMAVQDAQLAITVAEENAARSREAAARRVADAKRALQATTEQVAQAQIAANRAVEESERRIAEAHRGVLDAQRALTEARKADKAAVDETGRAAYDAKRAETDAAIAYRAAVKKDDQAEAAGLTGDALLQIDNNVNKAYAAWHDARKAVKETAAAHRKAEKEAKTGSQATRDAAQALADARQAEKDAVRDHADAVKAAQRAERDGARAIADARRGIAEAIEAQEQAQVDATRAVEQAHRNLERVQIQQAEQAKQAGKESAEAMAKLTPSAQRAVRSLLAVYDQLGRIRRIAQENFFQGFSAPLVRLANTVMPQLATGVGAIASAMGSGAQILMRSLTTALGGGVLESLLMGVATSVRILNRAIDPLVQAFVTLGVVGMDYMPRLADAIADTATRFNKFIQGAAADGSLKRWIDDGIQGLKDLWSIAGSVVGIFGALTAAAAAGGAVATLGGLADGLNRVENIMKGDVFQTTMATIFRGAEQGAQGLLAALNPIGDAFVRGAGAFADFLRLGGELSGMFVGGIFTALSNPSFGSGLTTFMQALKAGVAELVPLMPGLTAAFGRILETLAPIAQQLGPTLVVAFTNIANAVGNVLSFLSPLLVKLAGSPAVLTAIIGTALATAVAISALTAAAKVQQVVLAGVRAVMGLVSIAQGVHAAVTRRGTAAIATNTIAMRAYTVATKIGAAAQWVLNKAMRANPIGLIITGITLLVGALVWFFTKTEVGQRIWKRVWGAIKVVAAAFVLWFCEKAMPLITSAIKNIGNFFTWLWKNAIKPAFQAIGKFIGWVWKNLIKPAFKAIGWFIEHVLVPVIKWWWNKIVKPYFGFIGDLAKWLWEKAIKPAFKAIGRFIENTLAPAVKWLWKNVIKPIFNTIGKHIKNVWEDWIKPAFSALTKGVEKLPNAFEKAKDGIGKAWSKLQSIAKKPVKFVVNKVINDGLIGTFNKIPGVNLPDVELPRGFAKGGLAPRGWAMVGEEGPELVNFTNPGRVYTAKETGAALKHTEDGAAATRTGGGGGFGAIWGPFQNAIRNAGKLFVGGGAGPAWQIGQAASMWDRLAGLRVKGGSGYPQANTSMGALPSWMLAWATGAGNITFNTQGIAPGLSSSMKRATAAHEIGHVLGLPHTGAASIMQPVMGKYMQPTSFDKRRLESLYGEGSRRPGGPVGPPPNPFMGLVDKLVDAIRERFPAGGMFIDAAVGLAKAGIDQVTKWVGSFAGNIADKVSGIAGNVVDALKNFFGGYANGTRSAAPGWSWVGERGPELLRFRGGEQVLSNQESMQHLSDISKFTLQGGGLRPGDKLALVVDGHEFTGYVRAESVRATGGALDAADDRLQYGGKYVRGLL